MKRTAVFLLALLFLCSCAAAPKTGRVSEEELAKLREAYPYYDGIHSLISVSMGQYQSTETLFDFFSSQEHPYPYVLAEIRVISEPYYTTTHKDYPGRYKDFDDFKQRHPDLDEKMAYSIFADHEQQVDAKLMGVLWGSSELKKGTTFSLVVPDLQPPDTVDLFQKDGRFICVLVTRSDYFGPHSVLPHITTKYLTWHITKDDVILSATSEPGPDSFSGLYLESFKQEVLAILNEE